MTYEANPFEDHRRRVRRKTAGQFLRVVPEAAAYLLYWLEFSVEERKQFPDGRRAEVTSALWRKLMTDKNMEGVWRAVAAFPYRHRTFEEVFGAVLGRSGHMPLWGRFLYACESAALISEVDKTSLLTQPALAQWGKEVRAAAAALAGLLRGSRAERLLVNEYQQLLAPGFYENSPGPEEDAPTGKGWRHSPTSASELLADLARAVDVPLRSSNPAGERQDAKRRLFAQQLAGWVSRLPLPSPTKVEIVRDTTNTAFGCEIDDRAVYRYLNSRSN